MGLEAKPAFASLKRCFQANFDLFSCQKKEILLVIVSFWLYLSRPFKDDVRFWRGLLEGKSKHS